MLFHLDEHIAPAVCDGLRRRGIDVTTTPQEGLCGASDEEQLAFVYRSQRVVVTRDVDFIRLHNRQMPYAGIVFLNPRTRSVGEIVRLLDLLHTCLEPSDMAGQVAHH